MLPKAPNIIFFFYLGGNFFWGGGGGKHLPPGIGSSPWKFMHTILTYMYIMEAPPSISWHSQEKNVILNLSFQYYWQLEYYIYIYSNRKRNQNDSKYNLKNLINKSSIHKWLNKTYTIVVYTEAKEYTDKWRSLSHFHKVWYYKPYTIY